MSGVNYIFFEGENQAWIATSTGVFKVELKLNPFKNYFALAPGTNSVNTATSVRVMLVDDEQLWICDVTGIFSSLDLTSGETTSAEFQLNTNRVNRKRRKLSILHDDDNKLLLGGLDLVTYQSDKKEYRAFSSEYDSLSNDSIWSMYNLHRSATDARYEARNEHPVLIGAKIGKPQDSILEYYHEWLDKDGFPFYSFWDNVGS